MFSWYTEESRQALERKLFLPGEDILAATVRIADKANEIYGHLIPDFGSRVFELIEKGWIAPSSPVWANFGTTRGLPISCFSQHIDDTMEAILDGVKETGMLTRMGGGTAGYFGNLRPKGSPISSGGKTNGPVSFMQMFDSCIRVVSQSNVRRGSFAAYLPIEHPDILDFLMIKDKGNPIQDLSFGITVTDAWLNAMVEGDSEKRKVWARVLESRKEKGMPYVIFIDTVNQNSPDVYQDKGLKITHSNLCSEILIFTDSEKTFVCCLTAMNLEKYDEWKDTDAVEVCTYFLDAVMEDFIERAAGVPGLEKALNFARDERALGLGATGWHTLLKAKGIPFDSLEARYLTDEVFSKLQDRSRKASCDLAEMFGEPPLLKGYGRRNSTLMAIAPNTSSGSIMNVSLGIEPDRSNYFLIESSWGIIRRRDKYLTRLLEGIGKNTEEVWKSILSMNGSVQHLDFLTAREKAVFKCFWEIDQFELLRQNGIRQKYVDQGISLNIFVPPGATAKHMNELHLTAWREGCKALYYQRSEHPNVYKDTKAACSSCEG